MIIIPDSQFGSEINVTPYSCSQSHLLAFALAHQDSGVDYYIIYEPNWFQIEIGLNFIIWFWPFQFMLPIPRTPLSPTLLPFLFSYLVLKRLSSQLSQRLHFLKRLFFVNPESRKIFFPFLFLISSLSHFKRGRLWFFFAIIFVWIGLWTGQSNNWQNCIFLLLC